MPTTSSLLKTAESARKKKLAYDDDVAAFVFQNSAKTQQDWDEYQDYLRTRQTSAPTGSEKLSYAKKLKSAEDSYVSAEIERTSIDILDGKGTTLDKYNRIGSLYERAVERGNMDLAQNLYYQAKRLEEQMINEQERAQRVAGAMATNGVKDIKKLIQKLQTSPDTVAISPTEAYKSLDQIGRELKTNGDTDAGFWNDAKLTTQAITDLVKDAYESASNQEVIDYIENDATLRGVYMGEKAFKIGGQSLSLDEVDLAFRSASANNPLYTVATGKDANGASTFKLVKNEVEDFIWALNEDGTYEAMEVQTRKSPEKLSQQVSPYGTPLTEAKSFKSGDKVMLYDPSTGVSTEQTLGGSETLSKFYDPRTKKYVYTKANDAMSVENRLRAKGFVFNNGKMTTPDGQTYDNFAIEGDKVRFFGAPNEYSQGVSGLYEINVTDVENFGALGNLNAGTVRAVAPDETSDFGIESEFGGRLSQSSQLGKQATLSMTGLSKYSTPKFSIDQKIDRLAVKNSGGLRLTGGVDDLAGYKAGMPGTSSLLQSAGMTSSLKLRQEQDRLAELNRQPALQAGPTPGLNQTPVRQIASSGAPVRQLKVTTPAPSRQTLSVPLPPQQPTRTATVTGVGNQGNFGTTKNLQVR